MAHSDQHSPVVEALEAHILSGTVTVVFDHFAQAQASLGTDQPGFASLVRLLEAGRAYVKLSAAYRISTREPTMPTRRPSRRRSSQAIRSVSSGEATGPIPTRHLGSTAAPPTSDRRCPSTTVGY